MIFNFFKSFFEVKNKYVYIVLKNTSNQKINIIYISNIFAVTTWILVFVFIYVPKRRYFIHSRYDIPLFQPFKVFGINGSRLPADIRHRTCVDIRGMCIFYSLDDHPTTYFFIIYIFYQSLDSVCIVSHK